MQSAFVKILGNIAIVTKETARKYYLPYTKTGYYLEVSE